MAKLITKTFLLFNQNQRMCHSSLNIFSIPLEITYLFHDFMFVLAFPSNLHVIFMALSTQEEFE